MKKFKKTLLTFLFSATLILCIAPLSVSAASNTNTNYSGFNQPETKGDYAYYNGKKVVRSSSTSVSEVKWMQAALNYCIKYEGLNASFITVDGSFGPASKKATLAFQKAANLSADGSFGSNTIKKMISVLNDGKKTFNYKANTGKNILNKCNIIETYTISSNKYYMATLKSNYNGIKKGSFVFLNSNYSAVTDKGILEKLLFTFAVDEIEEKSNCFSDLTNCYRTVSELNSVCKKILEAQTAQKMLGTTAGSIAGIVIGSNPKALIAGSEAITKDSYMFMATVSYLDTVTTKAIKNCNLVKSYCNGGITSYEEAKNVQDALTEARAAFLIAGTDCMLGLVEQYSSKKLATINSTKNFFYSMGGTLIDSYSINVTKILGACNTGKEVIELLNGVYGYSNCKATATETFKNIFNKYAKTSLIDAYYIQTKVAK